MRSPPMVLLGSLLLVLLHPPLGHTQAVPRQPALKVKAERRHYLKEARLTPDSALTIARTRVPGGTARQAELEQENGRLVYSFDLTVAGKDGIDEVVVDAKTGEVVEVSHESPEDEARERDAGPKPKAPAP